MLFASGLYSIKVLLFVSGGTMVVVGCGAAGCVLAPCNTVSRALLKPFLQTAHVAVTNDTREPKVIPEVDCLLRAQDRVFCFLCCFVMDSRPFYTLSVWHIIKYDRKCNFIAC